MWEGACPDSGLSASSFGADTLLSGQVPSRFCVSKYSLHRIFTSHPRQFAGFISLPRLYLKGH